MTNSFFGLRWMDGWVGGVEEARKKITQFRDSCSTLCSLPEREGLVDSMGSAQRKEGCREERYNGATRSSQRREHHQQEGQGLIRRVPSIPLGQKIGSCKVLETSCVQVSKIGSRSVKHPQPALPRNPNHPAGTQEAR